MAIGDFDAIKSQKLVEWVRQELSFQGKDSSELSLDGAGASPSHISQVLNGKTPITIEFLLSVAFLFSNVTLSDLFMRLGRQDLGVKMIEKDDMKGFRIPIGVNWREYVQNWRKDRRLSYTELAALSNGVVEGPTLGNVLRGAKPGRVVLLGISMALQVPYETLFEAAGRKTPDFTPDQERFDNIEILLKRLPPHLLDAYEQFLYAYFGQKVEIN